jgi:hypothetical protein
MSGDEPRAVVALVVDERVLALGSIDRSTPCDLLLVDRILRLGLAATRLGWSLRLTRVDGDLRELLDLVGLRERLVV